MVISTKSLSFFFFCNRGNYWIKGKTKQTPLQLLYFSPWIYIQCFDSLHFLLLNCTDWLSSLNNLYSSACVCAWVLSVLLYLCIYSWIVFLSSLHDSYFNHKKKQNLGIPDENKCRFSDCTKLRCCFWKLNVRLRREY